MKGGLEKGQSKLTVLSRWYSHIQGESNVVPSKARTGETDDCGFQKVIKRSKHQDLVINWLLGIRTVG